MISLYENEWVDGFSGKIVITNNGDTVLEDWDLNFDAPFEIDNTWGAEITSHEGDSYNFISNAPWTETISPGNSINFGFSVQLFGDEITEPTNYIFDGEPIDSSAIDNDDHSDDLLVPFPGVSIDFSVQDEWVQGFNGRFEITNNSDNILEDWQLQFDGAFDINRTWGVDITGQEGDTYNVMGNADWTNPILPGRTVNFGFSANYSGDEIMEPDNFIFGI